MLIMVQYQPNLTQRSQRPFLCLMKTSSQELPAEEKALISAHHMGRESTNTQYEKKKNSAGSSTSRSSWLLLQ